jgi:uncharacterized Tic20 family protein
MITESAFSREERTLASLAHASIVLGLFTNGVGGLLTALVIWLTQREKSAYVAKQSMQALLYQTAVFLVTMAAWCCWGVLYMAMIFVPLFADPAAFEAAPPTGLWAGLLLMAVPLGIWGLTIFYGLWGAVRCFGGHDFRYMIVGPWLESQ